MRVPVVTAPAVTAPAGPEGLPHRCDVQVLHLLVSPVHRYGGRPRDGATALPPDAPPESVTRALVLRGRGLEGDRYARRREHADAAVTVLAVEALEAVAAELDVPPFDPVLARRNVVLRGADVEALRGVDFGLDCGEGAVLLGGRRPAAPCAWLDAVLAPGAHAASRGRAGVRCAALGGGVLAVGPAVLWTSGPMDPTRAGQRPRRPALRGPAAATMTA